MEIQDDSSDTFGNQTAKLQLNGTITVKRANADSPTYVSVMTGADTLFAAAQGSMAYNVDDHRGYYLEKLAVSSRIYQPEFSCVHSAPATTQLNGTYTVSNDINVNTGFFDTAATGGVASGSSKSASGTLTDYEVINTSDRDRAAHVYQLRQVQGAQYHDTTSLPSQSWGDFSKLLELPGRAWSGFPAVHASGWKCADPSNLPSRIVIELSVNAVLTKVKSKWKFLSDPELEVDTHVFDYSQGWEIIVEDLIKESKDY